jgi:hypothetical protein
MGCSEQHVQHDGDKTEPAPAALPEAVVRGAAGISDFLRRPVDELNTSSRALTNAVVIKDRSIEVVHTTRSISDPDVIEIAQPFESAINKVLTKLDEYAQANGAKVEPSSVRSSSTGPISWLLTRKGIAEWVRNTFPVESFDLTRVQPDGTRRKVCQVQIAEGFFSGKVQVTVPRYPGGEIEGNAVEIALGLKRAPSRVAARPERTNEAPLNTDTAPAKASISAAPDFNSALTGELAKIAAEKQEKQIALADARKRVGLKPNASESEVQEMEGLVAAIERDVKDFLNDPRNKITAPEQAVDTGVVLRGSYQISFPESMKTLPLDKKMGLSGGNRRVVGIGRRRGGSGP